LILLPFSPLSSVFPQSWSGDVDVYVDGKITASIRGIQLGTINSSLASSGLKTLTTSLQTLAFPSEGIEINPPAPLEGDEKKRSMEDALAALLKQIPSDRISRIAVSHDVEVNAELLTKNVCRTSLKGPASLFEACVPSCSFDIICCKGLR